MPMSESLKSKLFPELGQIITKFGTPFHIYDEEGIQDSLRSLCEPFKSEGIPFKEFYAVKALPQAAIMNIVKGMGCGFDCSSIPELRLARAAGAKPADIMFTSNNTSQEEFLEAKAHGGCYINFDDEELLYRFPGPFPELFCCRLNPGNRKTGDEVNSIIGNPLNSKYGVPIERIVGIFAQAKVVGSKRFGLHTMVCSNDRNYRHMVSTLKLLLEVAGELYRKLRIKLEFVNIGGGIGIPYRPGDTPFEVGPLARECRILLSEFERKYAYMPRLFAESGRFVTGPHGVLVNRVINTYSKYKDFIGVEVAMPALMRVGMYDTAYHHCTLLDRYCRPKDGPEKIVTVAGSICENCDVLAKDISLPIAEIGDVLVTHDTGAHASAMTFNYNGRVRLQELLRYRDMSVRRICVAETYDDLTRRQRGLNGPKMS